MRVTTKKCQALAGSGPSGARLLLLIVALCAACSSTDTGEAVATPDTSDVQSSETTEPTETTESDPDVVVVPTPDLNPTDTHTEPVLLIEMAMPATGHTYGGETIAIVGLGFDPDCQVLIDGVEATYFLFVDENRLQITTPPHPTGSVRITVVTGDGRIAKLDNGFTYYNDMAIDAVAPASGPATGGTPITVTGAGFSPDTLLIIGQQKALSLEILDDHTLLGLTPPGTAGAADVIVTNHQGIVRQKEGFLYTAAVEVEAVFPAAGPTPGGQEVTIYGQGFTDPPVVWFGSTPAESVEWVSDSVLRATTPAHNMATVDVRVDGLNSSGVLYEGYRFENNDESTLAVVHYSPPSGPLGGGTLVAITATQLATLEDTVVTFGETPATLIEFDAASASLLVSSPPADTPGPVDLTLTSGEQSTTIASGFHYEEGLQLYQVSPASGPAQGGTEITLTGLGFSPGDTVYFGALASPSVTIENAEILHAVTPPGSPGLVDVRVVSATDQSVLVKAFAYIPEAPEIYVVIPEFGAIAGGTWVQIIGAGFGNNPTVSIGGNPAKDVQAVSPGLLTARTPPGNVGAVDVEVTTDSGNAMLEYGFTYYDPHNTFGGTWGDGVDLAVNITVLDGTTAQAVVEAFVILDDDPETPYQGFTNDDGQITFGGPDIAGAHTISVSKEGYVTYSVVHFDAENITVFLNPMQEGGGLGNIVPPGIVSGTVSGLGKYIMGTPGTCEFDESIDPIHCSPCSEPTDCGTEGALCADLGSAQGWHCLMPCTDDPDCPAKHSCQLMSGGKQCMPLPGEKVAICSGTKPYFRFFDIPLGMNAMADEEGNFSVVTFPTEIAIVCFGGFYIGAGEPTSEVLENAIKGNPANKFQPVAMGVARHLLLEPGKSITDVEIELNIPLNRTVHVRMEKPPLEDTDYLWAQSYLDFGEDGVIKMPIVRFLYNDEPFLLETMPQSLAGDIADATFTFYAGANSYKNEVGFYYPKAYVVRQNVAEPQDDRMLRLAGGVWTTEPTGLTQSLQGAHLFADDHVVTVGTGGSIYKFNGQTHLVMPTATKKTLRDVHGTDPDDLWAVGDDAMVLHFNGAAWSTEEVPTESDLRAVLVESDGTVLIAGNQTVLRRAPEGEWVKESSPAGNWYAIDETSSEDVWIVGRTGRVRHYNGTSWTLKSTPTEQGLRTVVARAPNDVWIGGESGTLMHWDGVDFSIIPPVTDQSLNDIQARGANELVAVGNYGTVLTYDGIAWVPAPITDYNQDLHAVALPPNTGNAYTFGDHQLILGPIVAPPRVSVPEAGGTLTENAVHWTADERVAPHYQHVEIYVPGLMGPVLIWELIADGDVGSAPLPDFAALQGTPGLQLGKHFLAVTRIYQEGFDIDNFDYTDLGSLDRQSWALEYFPFFTPTDTP